MVIMINKVFGTFPALISSLIITKKSLHRLSAPTGLVP